VLAEADAQALILVPEIILKRQQLERGVLEVV